MGSPILDVKDLSISFSTSGAEVEAVKKISFSVMSLFIIRGLVGVLQV